jgi:hypothetical protein
MLHPEAQKILEALPLEVRYRTWHLVYPDGRIESPPEAVMVLVGLLAPRTARVIRRIRLDRVVVRLERLVSAYRGELGKVVPRKGAIKRFP